jgi:dihydrodipicolinate synthase/N-acetylneuraminate lyase
MNQSIISAKSPVAGNRRPNYDNSETIAGNRTPDDYGRETIVGNWATLLLTTNRDGNIDYSRLTDEIDVLISSKPNGIYSCGTAGEFYALSETEFDAVSRLLSEKCRQSQTPFQIGVSHPSAQQSLERLRRIVALCPLAVQVILPDWFPVTNDEAVDFMQCMAETACGIGLVLYNPPHAKRRLNPEDWMYMKGKIPQLIGLKVFDNNGDNEWYAHMRSCSEGLSIFIPGHRMASGILKGAKGAYSNVACLNPFAAQKWYGQICTDMPAALELETRINRFMDQCISPLITQHHYPNQACDRFMALVGDCADVGAWMRWPYRSIPCEWVDEVRKVAIDLIPEFFRPKTCTP